MHPSRSLRWTLLGLALVIFGCEYTYKPAPSARGRKTERSDERPKEPPQVVDEPVETSDEPNDPIRKDVRNFINRFEKGSVPYESDPQHAADVQPLASRPVAEPAIPRIPDNAVETLPGPDPGPTTTAPTGKPAVEPATPEVTTNGAEARAEADTGVTFVPETKPKPPAITAVDVQPLRPDKEPVSEPVTPGINAPAQADVGPRTLRQFLEQMPAREDASFRGQLDRRLLAALAGDYARAREPLELVSDDQQALAGGITDLVISIRESNLLGDESATASDLYDKLDTLLERVRPLTDPKIATLKLCSAVRSFGQYDVIEPARFVAGGRVEFVIYCEVEDFASELRDDGLYYTIFDMTTQIFTADGESVLKIADPGVTDRCRNRREDCFIPRLVRLPASLSPGQYVAKVTIVDTLAEKVAENSVTFELVGRP
jgi:hypothetical protein